MVTAINLFSYLPNNLFAADPVVVDPSCSTYLTGEKVIMEIFFNQYQNQIINIAGDASAKTSVRFKTPQGSPPSISVPVEMVLPLITDSESSNIKSVFCYPLSDDFAKISDNNARLWPVFLSSNSSGQWVYDVSKYNFSSLFLNLTNSSGDANIINENGDVVMSASYLYSSSNKTLTFTTKSTPVPGVTVPVKNDIYRFVVVSSGGSSSVSQPESITPAPAPTPEPIPEVIPSPIPDVRIKGAYTSGSIVSVNICSENIDISDGPQKIYTITHEIYKGGVFLKTLSFPGNQPINQCWSSNLSLTNPNQLNLQQVGTYSSNITVKIDGIDLGQESNVDNNKTTLNITVTKPDLAFAAINWPTNLSKGSILDYGVKINNLGSKDTGTFSFKLLVKGPTDLDYVEKYANNEASISGGGNLSPVIDYLRNIAITNSVPGNYDIKLVLDDSQSIDESNETNNILSQRLIIDEDVSTDSPKLLATGQGSNPYLNAMWVTVENYKGKNVKKLQFLKNDGTVVSTVTSLDYYSDGHAFTFFVPQPENISNLIRTSGLLMRGIDINDKYTNTIQASYFVYPQGVGTDLATVGFIFLDNTSSSHPHYYVEAMVRNFGNTTTPPNTMKWYLDGVQIGFGGYGKHLPGMDYAQSADNVRYEFKVDPASSRGRLVTTGIHNVKYCIDSTNQIVETNENNNCYNKDFLFGTQSINDRDSDGILDGVDNCPQTYNPDQSDTDGNGIGDVCENNIEPQPIFLDYDVDGISDDIDNCPQIYNPNQLDSDVDGIGDLCEGDDPGVDPLDIDQDGIPNNIDNCPNIPNPNQQDSDNDGIGDVCEEPDNYTLVDDYDNDGILNINDNCPVSYNPDQLDTNSNGVGDVCEDSDDDGIPDDIEDKNGLDKNDPTDSGRRRVPTDLTYFQKIKLGLPLYESYTFKSILPDSLLKQLFPSLTYDQSRKFDPALIDSDGDGLLDGYELLVYNGNPFDPTTIETIPDDYGVIEERKLPAYRDLIIKRNNSFQINFPPRNGLVNKTQLFLMAWSKSASKEYSFDLINLTSKSTQSFTALSDINGYIVASIPVNLEKLEPGMYSIVSKDDGVVLDETTFTVTNKEITYKFYDVNVKKKMRREDVKVRVNVPPNMVVVANWKSILSASAGLSSVFSDEMVLSPPKDAIMEDGKHKVILSLRNKDTNVVYDVAERDFEVDNNYSEIGDLGKIVSLILIILGFAILMISIIKIRMKS